MGSSGGFLGNIQPEEFMKKIRLAEEKSTSSEFNGAINNKLNQLLTEFNNRPIEDIQKHLEVLRSALSSELECSINLIFGGSVAKHTYVNGLSDVDSLAIINNTGLENYSPHEILDYFVKRIKLRLPNSNVSKGNLAVTINYTDNIQVQILPAIKTVNGYKIPEYGFNQWSNIIRPTKFAEKLTEINTENGQKVVPIIKLAKAIISNLPEKRKISGYHAESIAIEAFKNYEGSLNLKEMLKHYFSEATNVVLKPIKDKSGQSVHVDDYLGEKGTIHRHIVSDSLAQLTRRLLNADATQQIDQWESIFTK